MTRLRHGIEHISLPKDAKRYFEMMSDYECRKQQNGCGQRFKLIQDYAKFCPFCGKEIDD